MGMISVEKHGKVLLARLNHGVTNALNPKVFQELGELLIQVENDDAVNGLVLGSANEKFFSIGFDIPELYEMKRDDFSAFYRMFNRVCMGLYTLPKPTVAAITGHAIAGGCILALCCDYRFIAKGKKLMGLNEVKLGVPVPYLPDRVLHALAGARKAREMMESGRFYSPDEMFDAGVVDEVLLIEEVLKHSIEHAERLGSLSEMAYGVIKQNRVEVIAEQVASRQEDKAEKFIECWFSDVARECLKEAMKAF